MDNGIFVPPCLPAGFIEWLLCAGPEAAAGIQTDVSSYSAHLGEHIQDLELGGDIDRATREASR